MKNIDALKLYQGTGFIRIIADERIVPIENFDWHNEKGSSSWITLNEISERLKRLGFVPVYYVWEDTPLQGSIYQYGNDFPDTEIWEEYGTTKGFA